ncbi:AAA family ATPase [Janthinobacterium lividum]
MNIEKKMISKIEISNYKSIEKITLNLGRINVFIGENGAGKSNILEAIALAGATAAEKLDNEFLVSRGIRLTKPEFMRSAFEKSKTSLPISIKLENEKNESIEIDLQNDNSPYSKWKSNINYNGANFDWEKIQESLKKIISLNIEKEKNPDETRTELKEFLEILSGTFRKLNDESFSKENENQPKESHKTSEIKINLKSGIQRDAMDLFVNSATKESEINRNIRDFLIYSPENSSLRLLEKEGQIEPLGINGEGLLRLLHFYSGPEHFDILESIKTPLKSLGWFGNFNAAKENNEERIILNDRYLDCDLSDFDQRSANEGFLFLLFYLSLFHSKLTPNFFAIDNIDASLNPKLCQKLTSELVKISKKSNKQAILTTHNPSVLDGLNLDDDEQRLFVISRSKSGATKIKRIMKPHQQEEAPPYRLSELFLRGTLGGLPKGF